MATATPRTPFRPSPRSAAFRGRVSELSGEDLNLCYQCGACSSACPLTDVMDLTPSKVVRLAQLGVEEVTGCGTIWVCSTCFSCEVRCPRGIDIASVMEALRQLMLRRRYSHVALDALPPGELRGLPQVAIVSNLRKLSA